MKRFSMPAFPSSILMGESACVQGETGQIRISPMCLPAGYVSPACRYEHGGETRSSTDDAFEVIVNGRSAGYITNIQGVFFFYATNYGDDESNLALVRVLIAAFRDETLTPDMENDLRSWHNTNRAPFSGCSRFAEASA